MPFRLNDPEMALFNSIGAMSGDPDPGSERDAAITLDAFQGILARGSESRATGGVSPFQRSLRVIPTRGNRPTPVLRGQDESQPNQKAIDIVKSEATSRLDERFDISGKIEAIGKKTGISKAVRKVDTSIDRLLGINPNAPGAPAPVQGGVGTTAPEISAPTPGVAAPSASAGVAADAAAGGAIAPAAAAPAAASAVTGATGVVGAGTTGAALTGAGAAAGAGASAGGAAAAGAGAASGAGAAAGGASAGGGIWAALATI